MVGAVAGAEGCLEKVGVGGRDTVPTQRVEKGGKLARRVEVLVADTAPSLVTADVAVEFLVPIDGDLISLGVIINGEKSHGRSVAWIGFNFLNEPVAAANPDNLAWLAEWGVGNHTV